MKREDSAVVCRSFPKLLFAILFCFASVILTNAQNTSTFTNPNPVTIPGTGTGPAISSPYPSAINVSGVIGNVAKVTVRFNNLGHSFPGDIDVLLVGPGGQNAIIMSDVGGADDVANVNLTLDDAAATPLPLAALTSGTFQPTNSGGNDTFPAPAPVPLGGSAFSIFNGINPNGVWNLYVYDDAGVDVGTFAGGWTINITNNLAGENQTPISILDNGAASPYPSEIQITNQTGLLSAVQLNLQNFSHTSPDDVDLMLVSPSGRRVIVMSDVGGANPVSNLNLFINDLAANSLPDNGAIISGSYKPTDFEPGDSFPAPAPGNSPTGRMLSAFNGDNGNGAWKLFLVDDNGNNAGSISAGWSIVLQSSTDVIDIPANGAASPYPSDKLITGQQGNVTKVVVTLTNFSHTSPDDVDILLVAPSGRRVVLMSDVGGNTEVGRVNFVFDDAAAGNLPDGATLTSGTYKPTDFEPGDVFPAPAPQGATSGATLNAFYGSAPNGIWKLFVVDDNGENLGSVAGSWNLTIQSSTTACVFTISPTFQSFPITGGSGNFAVNMPAGCSWSASTVADFITINSNSSGTGSGTISFSVPPNMGGGQSGSIDVTNGFLVRNFQVQQPSGCPFSLAQSQVDVGSAGGSRSVDVTAGGICSWQATSPVNWIQITSPQQTGSGPAAFNILPNSNIAARSATITVGARSFTVNQAGASARRFDFDGDTITDISVFRPSNGTWYILNSGTAGSYSAIPFGLETDRIAPADFDGDRRTDFAIYRDGGWYIFQSQTNTVRTESWGLTTDTPVPGDFDGDGRSDLAVYRSTDGTWYVRRSTDGVYQATAFGLSTDKPLSGDFDGDGRVDFALYRVGNVVSSWAILNSSNGQTTEQQFGNAGDIAVPGDFDGDGRDNFAVFRPSNATWYTSLDPGTNYGAKQWGITGDIPAAGDYNGDGRADYVVYRDGVWWILHSNDNTHRAESWGLPSDKVVPATFNAQ